LQTAYKTFDVRYKFPVLLEDCRYIQESYSCCKFLEIYKIFCYADMCKI